MYEKFKLTYEKKETVITKSEVQYCKIQNFRIYPVRSEGLRHFIGRLICAGVRARTGSGISEGVRAGGVSVLHTDPGPELNEIPGTVDKYWDKADAEYEGDLMVSAAAASVTNGPDLTK
jgi:Glu-tRNA(Gln) amidotransferase subunit E-like FAD-binding protein